MRSPGGYRQGSGLGKKGWYKGIFCDSSWEFAYVLYCEIHSISIKRNLEKFPYEFEGKTYMYLPDFIAEDEFVEIKGYMTERKQNLRIFHMSYKYMTKITLRQFCQKLKPNTEKTLLVFMRITGDRNSGSCAALNTVPLETVIVRFNYPPPLKYPVVRKVRGRPAKHVNRIADSSAFRQVKQSLTETGMEIVEQFKKVRFLRSLFQSAYQETSGRCRTSLRSKEKMERLNFESVQFMNLCFQNQSAWVSHCKRE